MTYSPEEVRWLVEFARLRGIRVLLEVDTPAHAGNGWTWGPKEEKTSLYPNVIMRGTKLILMEVGNVKFLDSLNYFPMPLTALPKAFDLKELKKGYFPHLFNTLAHQNYVGPIPALDFYDPDHLKEDAREKLLKWHGERQAEGYVFDFQKEIVEYCISDVEILTQACLKFRDLMKTETTVDPFQESTTIASCCNKVFRRNFLKPETIGKVEERAVYVDTDSCIYISRKGLDDISTGDFIGDMTDELNGGFISEFVSGGPKNYAYKYTTLSGEEQIVCKVKGISLNYKASQVVNFEKIKDMVLKKSDPVSVLSRQLRRTREHAVVTVEFLRYTR
ncbi:unnamed protein product [Acanthoscelides obtectus]|uniref:DNA-directed DNA polymerase n=1 Tax=Acanthoscelides obtectus TaxID=200917 RepID=A0A9P0MMD7_ACAOB|nr:unnamed protein product [Acanthoscelides obtectus]CAK1635832.1 Probable beta-hexosaminidase fdl [Acanthoscelides obtectus]